MPDFNLNKEYIDLNSSPADNDTGHLPVPSSENVPIITEEHNDVQPLGGPTLIENSREPLFPSMPGETSGPPPKRSSSKRPQDLPAGWMMEECVRHSGKSAGKTDKFFIEPLTRKKFRSMLEVRCHLGMADPKPSNNYAMKFQVHGGSLEGERPNGFLLDRISPGRYIANFNVGS